MEDQCTKILKFNRILGTNFLKLLPVIVDMGGETVGTEDMVPGMVVIEVREAEIEMLTGKDMVKLIRDTGTTGEISECSRGTLLTTLPMTPYHRSLLE